MSNRKQKKQAVLAKRVAAVKLYKKRCQVKVGAVTVSALSFERVVRRSMKAYRKAATIDNVLGSLNNLTTHLNEQLEGYVTGPDGVKVDLQDLDVGALLLTSCLSEEEQANQAVLQKLGSKHLLESRELSVDHWDFLRNIDAPGGAIINIEDMGVDTSKLSVLDEPGAQIVMSDEAIAQRWDPSKPNEDKKGS